MTDRGRNGAHALTCPSNGIKSRNHSTPSAKRVALITGGAKGIGRAVARHLASAGWRLGIIDLRESGLRRIYRHDRGVLSIEGDVRNEKTVADAVKTLMRRFGRLDAVVSNAGIMVRKPLHRLTLAEPPFCSRRRPRSRCAVRAAPSCWSRRQAL